MNNAGIVALKREGYCGYKTLKGAYIKEKQVLRVFMGVRTFSWTY